MEAQARRVAFAKKYLDNLGGVLRATQCDALAEVIGVLEGVLRERRCVFLAGNGGSAATASHMANDLMKTCAGASRCGLRAIALSDNAQLVTAIANDEGYEHIFSRQLQTLAHEGDVLIVLSGSGNSPNILSALRVAHAKKLRTIGFLGKGGGEAKTLVNVAVIVPSDDYGPIEDVHLVFNHLITSYLRDHVQC